MGENCCTGKKLSMAVAVLLLVAAFALVGLMKVELMPAIDEGTVSVEATFRSGTKVSEVDARMQELEAMVAAHPDVESYTPDILQGLRQYFRQSEG